MFEVDLGPMQDETRPSPFIVYKSSIGFIPVDRSYYCIACEQDISLWVLKQPRDEDTACPHCGMPIDAEHVAQAQRETKFGCLLSIVALASLFLIPAAIAVVTVWLL